MNQIHTWLNWLTGSGHVTGISQRKHLLSTGWSYHGSIIDTASPCALFVRVRLQFRAHVTWVISCAQLTFFVYFMQNFQPLDPVLPQLAAATSWDSIGNVRGKPPLIPQPAGTTTASIHTFQHIQTDNIGSAKFDKCPILLAQLILAEYPIILDRPRYIYIRYDWVGQHYLYPILWDQPRILIDHEMGWPILI